LSEPIIKINGKNHKAAPIKINNTNKTLSIRITP
jgi:hypothetical protein